MDGPSPEHQGISRLPVGEDAPLAWVVLSPTLVPDRWRGRGMEAVVIPLLPSEAKAVLRGEPAGPEIGPEDEQLLMLVASGRSVSDIAGELGITARGLQHRLARLRRRFDVPSTADLAVLAERMGFGRDRGVKQRAKGSNRAGGE